MASKLVDKLCKNKAPEKMKVLDMLLAYRKKTTEKWRIYKINQAIRICRPLHKLLVNDLEGKDLVKIFESDIDLISNVRNAIRFVCDGRTYYFHKSQPLEIIPGADGTSDEEIKITHSFIDTGEALSMLEAFKGIYAGLKINIQKQLEKLPEDKTYSFKPNGIEDKKTLLAMRNNISAWLIKTKKPFTLRYSKPNGVFFIFHTSALKKGEK